MQGERKQQSKKSQDLHRREEMCYAPHRQAPSWQNIMPAADPIAVKDLRLCA